MNVQIDLIYFTLMIIGNTFFILVIVLFGKTIAFDMDRRFFPKGKVILRFVSGGKEVDTLIKPLKSLDKDGEGNLIRNKKAYRLDTTAVIFNQRIPELTYREEDAEPINYFKEVVFDAKVWDALLLRVKASSLPFRDLQKWLMIIAVILGIMVIVVAFLAYNGVRTTEQVSFLVKQAELAATNIKV